MGIFCSSLCLASVVDEAWKEYKLKYHKEYTADEDAVRYETWKKNSAEIETHNADYSDEYEREENMFADMTDEEFDQQYGRGLIIPEEKLNGSDVLQGADFVRPPASEVPGEMDWRTKGYVTPVKNQGRCGSCYSFSATGALEGAWFKKTGKLVSLSEQQIVDCSRGYGNHGCGGGFYESAWKYIKSYGGSETEESYPYEAREWICRFKQEKVVAQVSGHHNLPEKDEEALKQAVGSVGPVSVAIDASCRGFRSYRRGVYSHEGCRAKSGDLNHAVLAVGYGQEGGEEYWLVKNSWGTRYGDKGYVKIARNKGNMCGIAWRGAYPLV